MTASGFVIAALLSQAGQIPVQALPTIRGTVVDAKTNAPVNDARVVLVEASLETRTSADGRFEFVHVEPRTYTLTVSTIGYIFVRRRVAAPINTNLELIVPLAEGTGTYQETVTVSGDPASRAGPIGVNSQAELGSAGLAELRGVAADDPMRAIQALPGVATGDDFQAEFSVRGSAFRHVGVVIDGTPTQLLLHAIHGVTESGSVAMINTDILSRAALYSGPHARNHGDWLGATLEFDVREGSRDRFGARAAVSGTSASGVFEGPLGPGRRGSWLVSVRRSYIDWLVRKLEPDVDGTIGFSDAQVKLVYDVTPRQQLQFLAVGGDAAYRETATSQFNGLLTASSKSVLGSLSWRYAHSRAVVTQRVSAIRNDFLNQGLSGQHLADGHTRLLLWRADVVAPLGRGWTIDGGAWSQSLEAQQTLRRFASNGQGGLRVRFEQALANSPFANAGWIQASWRTERSGLAAGVRMTGQASGAGTQVLPWLLAERTVGSTTVRAAAGRSAQFLDPLVATLVPTNPVAETALSFDVGVEQPIGHGIRLLATAFYRDEADVLRRAGEDRLDPVTGLRIAETTFSAFAQSLSGSSRGVELQIVRRSATGLSGWVGYSWTHTRYRDRVTGERFDGDFDQRHTLNVFLQQRLSYRMTVSAKLRVGSNFPLAGYFEGEADPEALRLSAVRNEVRLPIYARLDVRANRTFTFQRSRLTLFVEVMNLLGRDNLRQADGTVRPDRTAIGFVDRVLPRVPSAGLLFEF